MRLPAYKAYDFEACVFDDEVYCNECLPVDIGREDVYPIFVDSDWDYPPVCCVCGHVHDYMTVLPLA